ncbi:HERC1, partial [Symbiodinium necroappetens]
MQRLHAPCWVTGKEASSSSERRLVDGDKAWACSCDISVRLVDAGPYKPDPSAKLSASPFHMTHDSATGYIGDWDLVSPFVNLKTLPEELPGLLGWVGKHPDELVIISASHCGHKGPIEYDSKNCTDEEFVKPFTDAGHVIHIYGDCLTSSWKRSVDSIEKVKPYVVKTMAKERGCGDPFIVQSSMQQTLQKLCVMQSFQLNKDIASWIQNSDLYDGVNFLEINTICTYGMTISSALGATISKTDADTLHEALQGELPGMSEGLSVART